MAFRAAFYNPDEVLIKFLGSIMNGYADGSFITVSQMAPGFDDIVGTDGEVARSKTNDRRLKIVIKLLQTSLSNALLSAAHQSDLNSPNGLGVGSFFMQDLSGGTIVSAPEAWIVSYPESDFDRKSGSREWEIRAAFGERLEGGN